MSKFDFIGGDDFRASLESDYAEMNAAMEARAWKAAHVLAGSIIEAILVDYLVQKDYKSRKNVDPLKMDLGKAIDACRDEGILTEPLAHSCNEIRSYRNLIHPGRVVRLGELVDEHGATIARALVERLVNHFTQSTRRMFRYDAAQIVEKVTSDSSVVAILQDLLRDCSVVELERLLLVALPTRYFEIYRELGLPVWDASQESLGKRQLRSLDACFRAGFELVPDDVKRKVARRFVSILKEDQEYRVLTYETAFFRGSDIRYLSREEAATVKAHIISRLSERPCVPLITAIEGIEQFIYLGDFARFMSGLLNAAAQSDTEELGEAVTAYITGAYYGFAEDVRNRIGEWLEMQIGDLRRAQRHTEAYMVEQWHALLSDAAIPF